MLLLREPAMKLQAELWRLKGALGALGTVELLDGMRLDLPPGERVEETVQRWFNSVKKAERGLRRVAVLERERQRQVLELGDFADAGPIPAGSGAGLTHGAKTSDVVSTPHVSPAVGSKTGRIPSLEIGSNGKQEKQKVEHEKSAKRADGKGRAYRSLMVDQFEVLIGKGETDNDNLTFRVADSHDFWLHVANLPGSHVIIRNLDKLGEPPKSVLERAAELAAYYSKARDGGKTEVHWCRVADVNKPRGFAPGKVLLKSHRSVKVYPRV
jgi:hypothetical protein